MLSRNSLSNYISFEPALGFARKVTLSGRIVVLMYHEVLPDEAIDAWTVVKKSDFIRQMDYLLRHFKIVSLNEALKIMSDSDQPDKNIAVVTFDDGYSGNYSIVLPVIKSMGIPVTFFISTGAVQNQTLYWYDQLIIELQTVGTVTVRLNDFGLGAYHISHYDNGEKRWTEIEKMLSDLKTLVPDERTKAVEYILDKINSRPAISADSLLPLTINEIKEMARSPLVTFGAHSHCHNRLIQLDKEKIKESINTSKDLLEQWTGQKILHFAYPNGDYDAYVIDVLKDAGFVSGLTTKAKLWEKTDSSFAIPRIGIGRYDSFGFFKARASGILI